MLKKTLYNSFFINTSIIILSGFIIKILGLLNKILITRYLGTEGMSLYIISFPTIILFLNISTLNINNTISKIISEINITKEYSPKKIITTSLKLTLLSSLVTIIILLIIIKPLTAVFLKNDLLLFPLLTTILLIPLTAISDTLKGYYNGLKQITKSTLANIIEQVTRIIFVLFVFFFFDSSNYVTTTTLILLALSFGELCSVIYLIFKIRKITFYEYPQSNNPTKKILSLALPSTFSKLIGSFTYFLEPIIYTWILSFLSYQAIDIQKTYTIINAYTIPLLTTASFISAALSTTIIPSISENYASKNEKNIKYLIDKVLIFCLVPSLLITLLLFYYPTEYMNLIYATNEGTNFIKPFVFLFLFYYLHMPFMSILHAIGKTKTQFWISTFFSCIRLILIIILSLIPEIGLNSIFYSVIITMLLNSLITILIVCRYTKYQINFKILFTLFLITIITYFILILFDKIFNNYLIVSIICLFIYLFLCYSFDLIKIKSLRNNS
ncbi:MAG: oligosaccharide flippase family protein [Bacilli bacterium]|nr:oligosaccharide flippase family protein [Bacilli bacterium]